jgi:serine/threonine protein kinase
MNSDDDLAITDFGLGRMVDSESSRVTPTGEGMGTPLYVAPEQWDDFKSADARSDIFTLGRMLYEFYTGRLTSSTQDVSQLPPGIAVIVGRCTQHDSARRYQSVTDLKEAWQIITGQTLALTSAEEVTQLIADLAGAEEIDPDIVNSILEVLVQHQDDADFLHESIMKLPSKAVATMFSLNADFTRTLIRKFINHVTSQGWGFSYTDKIGAVCKKLYNRIADYEIRAELVYCLMDVGYGHHRFYVMGLFKELMEGRKDPGEALVLYERLKGAPEAYLAEAKENLSHPKLDQAVRRLFP